MEQIHLIFIILIIAPLCFFGESNACTAFSLLSHNGIIVGKNLDWPVGDGFIVINQKNDNKFSLILNGGECVRWQSKYGSITFNQLGKEFPLGGMNEAGLVVEELSYGPSIYEADDKRPVINEFQWIQYQLDNFAWVHEVIIHIHELRVKKLLFGLHYFICDRSGNSAVIEFINGQTKVYDNDTLPVAVLSNNTYENSIRYLQKYNGFGGDDKIVWSRAGSQQRFLYTADLIKGYNKNQKKSLTDYGFYILNKVKQDDTQWSILYDPRKLEIYFHLKNRHEMNIIQFKEYTFESDRIASIDSINLSQKNDINFLPYSCKQNIDLLNTVFQELIRLNEIDQPVAEEIQHVLNQYHFSGIEVGSPDVSGSQ